MLPQLLPSHSVTGMYEAEHAIHTTTQSAYVGRTVPGYTGACLGNQEAWIQDLVPALPLTYCDLEQVCFAFWALLSPTRNGSVMVDACLSDTEMVKHDAARQMHTIQMLLKVT